MNSLGAELDEVLIVWRNTYTECAKKKSGLGLLLTAISVILLQFRE